MSPIQAGFGRPPGRVRDRVVFISGASTPLSRGDAQRSSIETGAFEASCT
jgi:hypothetical protein